MKQMIALALIAIGLLAVSVYRAKLGAREAEERIQVLEAENAALLEEVTVLRAEEAHLSRPERIGPIAREQLGMGPVTPDQVAAGASLMDGGLSPVTEADNADAASVQEDGA